MKKFLLSLLFAAMLFLFVPMDRVGQTFHSGVRLVPFVNFTERAVAEDRAPETDDEIAAAIEEFNRFADEHSDVIDFASFGRVDVGMPWFANLYHFDDQGNIIAKWEISGYPRAQDCVAEIEKDFTVHPEGYEGKFSGND